MTNTKNYINSINNKFKMGNPLYISENKTIEGVFNYFVEIIKKMQKNGYKKREVIMCLIDIHINALNVLEQVGDNEKEQIYIKEQIYDCFRKREEEKLKSLLAEKGESHG